MNYMTFEIGGGDNVQARFYRLRKKVNGIFTTLKRFNNNEELKHLPFFGYEVNTWYAVSIEIYNEKIAVYAALLGVTSKTFITKVKDDTLPFGYVGFGTSHTEAAFSEISVRPMAIPYSKLFS